MAATSTQLNILIKAKDVASRTIKGTTTSLGRLNSAIAKHQAKFAIGAAAIAAGLAKMASEAREQRKTQDILANSLENVGKSYEELGPGIEDTLQSMQDMTGVSDEDLREALSKLVTGLGDVDLAMEALPAVMDMAALSGKKVGKVANTLIPAFKGATNTVSALGIVYEKTEGPAERIAKVMDMVGGAAEAGSDPVARMKTTLFDMAQSIGEQVLPLIDSMATSLQNAIKWFNDLDDTTTKWITRSIMLVGAISAVLFIVPKLVAAFKLLRMVMATTFGPIGLLITLAGALGVALVEMGDDVEKVEKKSKDFPDIIEDVGDAADDSADAIEDFVVSLGTLSKEGVRAMDTLNKGVHSVLAAGGVRPTMSKLQLEVAKSLGIIDENFGRSLTAGGNFVKGNVNGINDLETRWKRAGPEMQEAVLKIAQAQIEALGIQPELVDSLDEVDGLVTEARGNLVGQSLADFNTLKEQSTATLGLAADDWAGIYKQAGEAIVTTSRGTTEKVIPTFDDMAEGVDTSISKMVLTLDKLGEAMAGPLKSALNLVGGAMEIFINSGLRPWVMDLIDRINAFATMLKYNTGLSTDAVDWTFAFKKVAQGTLSAPGGMALVGERGPELVGLPRGARVMSATETQTRLGGATGGITNYGEITLAFPDVTDATGVLEAFDLIGEA